MHNCPICTSPIRNNRLGACSDECRSKLWEQSADGGRKLHGGSCGAGCGRALQSNNKTGYCRDKGCLAARAACKPKRVCSNPECDNPITAANSSGICSGCKYGVAARRNGPPCDKCGKRLYKSKDGSRTTCTDCLRTCSCGKPKTPRSKECVDCCNEKIGNRRFVDERPGKGYVKISVPTGEVDKTGRKRCRLVYEHRHVMERRLGRRLFPHEEVHHKNGARDDNRDANLELWSTNQPKGQRVEDKVAWAKELLALYEPESLATR